MTADNRDPEGSEPTGPAEAGEAKKKKAAEDSAARQLARPDYEAREKDISERRKDAGPPLTDQPREEPEPAADAPRSPEDEGPTDPA